MTEATDQSLDSIIQRFEEYSQKGIDISPYLSAIQSLDGKTPSEKYKKINGIVAEYVDVAGSEAQRQRVPVEERVPAAMVPLLKIRVGVALKSNEAVIEALKSEDVPVVNQAFKAKWFFDSSNEIARADYFLDNVMPHVSKRTRFGIIKALSQGLRHGNDSAEKKAEAFYRAFVELYGVDESLPLLPACGVNYIRAELQRPKLLLPYKILVELFRKEPDLAIYCLRRFVSGRRYQKSVASPLMKEEVFQRFLPHLIRRHVDVFVELYNPTQDRYSLKIGSTNIELFFKQAADVVAKKAKVFEDLFPLKVISRKLALGQFEVFFANLFPDSREQFRLDKAIAKLEYYPRDKREQLLTRTYETKYSCELSVSDSSRINSMELKEVHNEISAELFEKLFLQKFPASVEKFEFATYFNMFETLKYPREKTYELLDRGSREKWGGKGLFGDVCALNIHKMFKQALVKLMPAELRASQVAKFLEKCEEKSDEYYAWYAYMPPRKSLGFFKDAIAKASNDINRLTFIKHMLESCAIDKNNEDLREFLEYFNRRHKNEKPEVLLEVFMIIDKEYDLNELNDESWIVIKELLVRSHTKSELTRRFSLFSLGSFLDAAVHRALIRNSSGLDDNEQERAALNVVFDMTLDFNLTKKYEGLRKWFFVKKDYELSRKTPASTWTELKKRLAVQRYCFERLAELVPQKFPPNHSIWQKNYKNISIKSSNASAIVKQVAEFNRSVDELKKLFEPNCDLKKLSVADYPWLVEFIRESLQNSSKDYEYFELRSLMVEHELELLKLCRGNSNSDDENDDEEESYIYNRKNSSKNSIKTGRALVKLRKTHPYVLERLDGYLNKCRALLKLNTKRGGAAARRFLLATKWYEGLPELIVVKCLRDVKGEGSVKVLGVMLEGEVFGSLIAQPLAPGDSAVKVDRDDSKDYYSLVKAILPAMNLTSPPTSFESIILFCQGEYAKLAAQALTNTSERVTKAKIESFAEQLIDKPIAVKKHGIRLFFKIASRDDLRLFVKRLWRSETHPSIREMIATLVRDLFVDELSEANWKLVLVCIDALTENDEVPIKVLTDVKSIKNEYTQRYVEALLDKFEGLPEPKSAQLSHAGTTGSAKNNWIGDLLRNASCYNSPAKLFSEEYIVQLVEKYCFVKPSPATVGLLSGAEAFAKNVFGKPFSNKYYKFSFSAKQN